MHVAHRSPMLLRRPLVHVFLILAEVPVVEECERFFLEVRLDVDKYIIIADVSVKHLCSLPRNLVGCQTLTNEVTD